MLTYMHKIEAFLLRNFILIYNMHTFVASECQWLMMYIHLNYRFHVKSLRILSKRGKRKNTNKFQLSLLLRRDLIAPIAYKSVIRCLLRQFFALNKWKWSHLITNDSYKFNRELIKCSLSFPLLNWTFWYHVAFITILIKIISWKIAS